MIKKTDFVEELLEKYDGINVYLMKKGIVCIRCGEPVWGTLEELVEDKGMDIDEVVADLNEQFTG
jgi:hypothetical protein